MLPKVRNVFGILLGTWLLASAEAGYAAEQTSVVVVYNKEMPESKEVAEHYASKRQIPSSHIIGLDLPKTEVISRKDYEDRLHAPLLKALESKKLMVFGNAPTAMQSGRSGKVAVKSSIRYALLCYGVPVKITADPGWKDERSEKTPPQFKRNEAAVDSELATLPLTYLKIPRTGPFNNATYAATNLNLLHPTNGVLMVARLDGPSAEIAKGLVDKALIAETHGLWGRGYFDTRGVNEGPYKMGDDWIKACAQLAANYGYDTVMNDAPSVFPYGAPLSHIALYFGWYEQQVSGAFQDQNMEFMPGAVAYHLHSFSANVLRSPTSNWVGPLLAAGATATMGCTEEPYLDGTPDLPAFLSRLMYRGFTFAEAAYAAQRSLSWQTTVVGDPLYRPFGRRPEEIFATAEKTPGSPAEWAYTQVVNRLIMRNEPTETVAKYVDEFPLTKQSAVLSEKLGDIYRSKGKLSECIDPYLQALKLNPSPKQRLRISMTVGRLLGTFDRPQEAYDLYSALIKDYAGHPELRDFYAKLAEVAQTLGKKEEAEEFRKKSRPPIEPAAGVKK